MQLFAMLLTFFTMEQTLFRDYESRLQLDEVLRQMRADFEVRKEQLRRKMIVHYNVAPPPAPVIETSKP